MWVSVVVVRMAMIKPWHAAQAVAVMKALTAEAMVDASVAMIEALSAAAAAVDK